VIQPDGRPSRSNRLSLSRVSIVIPTLNEAENLPHVLPRIPEGVHEVILVDGHSTDDTIQVARELLPSIHIIQQDGRGKGNALQAGFRAATGDIVVMLDGDGSTDPAEIPRFVGALYGGADFAKGSRFLHGGGTADMPFYRQLGNRTFVSLVRMMFGGHYTDLCYGYNAFWASEVRILELNGNGFEIETMMNVRALQAGLRVVEVPSYESKRVYGSGRLKTFPDGWRVLKTIWHERVQPIRPQFVPETLDQILNEPNEELIASTAPLLAEPLMPNTVETPSSSAADAD
jgi:glycosyltransferase involved in cell wall biosynthesis